MFKKLHVLDTVNIGYQYSIYFQKQEETNLIKTKTTNKKRRPIEAIAEKTQDDIITRFFAKKKKKYGYTKTNRFVLMYVFVS